MRIRAKDVLDMMAAGATANDVLASYPDLEREDVQAILEYAAQVADIPTSNRVQQ